MCLKIKQNYRMMGAYIQYLNG